MSPRLIDWSLALVADVAFGSGIISLVTKRRRHLVPQSTVPFVPPDFQVPKTLETAEFRLRMLTVHDVIKDYEAVMTSVAHLRRLYPNGKWPEGLTLEQNLLHSRDK
jgi:hypothetical protein